MTNGRSQRAVGVFTGAFDIWNQMRSGDLDPEANRQIKTTWI